MLQKLYVFSHGPMQKLETKKPIHWLIVTNTVSLRIKERSRDIQNNNWRFWQTEDQKTQQDFNIAFLFVGSENFFYSHLSIVLSLTTVRSSVLSVAAVFNVISFPSPALCPSFKKKTIMKNMITLNLLTKVLFS